MNPQHRIRFYKTHKESGSLRIGKRSVLIDVPHHLPICLATIIRVLIDTVYNMNDIRFFCYSDIRDTTRVLTSHIMTAQIATECVWLAQNQNHTVKRHSDIDFFYIDILYRFPVRMGVPARAHHDQEQAQHQCHKTTIQYL